MAETSTQALIETASLLASSMEAVDAAESETYALEPGHTTDGIAAAMIRRLLAELVRLSTPPSNGLDVAPARPVVDAEDAPSPTPAGEPPERSFVNDPSPEGAELGAMLARFVDAEMDGPRILRPRCDDCAFLRGTEPNQIAGTVMTALKCVIEKEPFYCHWERGVSSGKLCAGWEALIEAKGIPGLAPWDFLEPAEPPHPPSEES